MVNDLSSGETGCDFDDGQISSIYRKTLPGNWLRKLVLEWCTNHIDLAWFSLDEIQTWLKSEPEIAVDFVVRLGQRTNTFPAKHKLEARNYYDSK